MSSTKTIGGKKTNAKKTGAAKGAGKAAAKSTSKAKVATSAAKAATPKPEGKLSCLDAAAAVLKSSGKPMQCKQMIDAMFAAKLWHSDAPTPAATLYSAILREITKKGKESRFTKTERGHFALKA